MDAQLQAQLPGQLSNQMQTPMSAQMHNHLATQMSGQLPPPRQFEVPALVNQEGSTPAYEMWKGDCFYSHFYLPEHMLPYS